MSADAVMRVSFRPAGVGVLTLALFLLLLGVTKVNGACMAVGLAVGLVFWVVYWLARRNLVGLEVGMEPVGGVCAGVLAGLRLRIAAEQRIADGVDVHVSVRVAGQREVVMEVASVAAGGVEEAEVQVVLPTRGRFGEHPARLRSAFPFGWFEVERWSVVRAPVEVRPRVLSLRQLGDGGDGLELRGALDAVMGNLDAGGDWRGLRCWRAGDSMKKIAWPATLRQPPRGVGMEWLVREEDPPRPEWGGCLVVFHSWGDRGGLIRMDRFERALSMLLGAVMAVRRMGMRCRWSADFTAWSVAGVDRVGEWNELVSTLVGCERQAGTTWDGVAKAINRASERELVLVISDVPLELWQERLPRRRWLEGMSPSRRESAITFKAMR